MDIQTCLQVLELEAPITPARIHRAYRRMVKRWHPDQFAAHEPSVRVLAEEHLKTINEAYAILKAKGRTVQTAAAGSADNMRAPFYWRFSDRLKSTLRAASGKRRKDTKERQSSQSPRKDHMHSGHAGTAKGQKPAPACPISQFERILREKGHMEAAVPNPRSSGASHACRWRPARSRSGALRVDGFTPASPWQPIHPVSKIGPIEGSD